MARLLEIALKHFKAVLEKDFSNIFAAHALAAVLAEMATRAEPAKLEYLIHAKKIFEKVSSFVSPLNVRCLCKHNTCVR